MASPELLRTSIKAGLIGSMVAHNVEKHLTAVKNAFAFYTLMQENGGGVFSKQRYTVDVYFFCAELGIESRGACMPGKCWTTKRGVFSRLSTWFLAFY